MPLELIKERMILDNQAGEQSAQLLVEGDIIVPDSKPDIDNILRCFGQPRILEEKVNDGRVSFVGDLLLNVIYQAKKSRKPIHSMEASLPIEDFIHMEGLDKDAHVVVSVELNHLECKLINDRKITVKAVLTVTAKATKETDIEVIKSIEECPQMQTLTETMKVNRMVENKKDRFNIKEELALAAGKPNIEEILQTDVTISDKEIRAMDGRVMTRGNLKVSVLYIGDTEDSIVEIMEFEIPFSGYIDGKNITAKMLPMVELSVENKDIRAMSDVDGEDRLIDCEVTIKADMKVMDTQEMDMIADAYYPNKDVEITREPITYSHLVGRNKNQYTIKETVTIDEKADPMMQVTKVWATVSLDDVEVKNDMIEVDGVITLEIFYIGENDDSPVTVLTWNTPFSQEIEVKGVQPDDDVVIDAKVEDVSFNMLSNREVETRVNLGFDVLAFKEENGEIITDILVDEEGRETLKAVASALIYVVQKGDNLWSIAKKYNTTVEDILLLNEIDNPDKIYPGQKILILKKISE